MRCASLGLALVLSLGPTKAMAFEWWRFYDTLELYEQAMLRKHNIIPDEAVYVGPDSYKPVIVEYDYGVILRGSNCALMSASACKSNPPVTTGVGILVDKYVIQPSFVAAGYFGLVGSSTSHPKGSTSSGVHYESNRSLGPIPTIVASGAVRIIDQSRQIGASPQQVGRSDFRTDGAREAYRRLTD